MALDRWVPSRFANLSERLVSSNGVAFMALSAAAVLMLTGSAVHILVVLYSINVFLTFSLAQLGMIRDALILRGEKKSWKRPLFVSGLGFIVTGSLPDRNRVFSSSPRAAGRRSSSPRSSRSAAS